MVDRAPLECVGRFVWCAQAAGLLSIDPVSGPYTAHVATRDRTVRLTSDSYELLEEAARKRGIDPDALADELLRSDLAAQSGEDLDAVLASSDELRARLPEIDGVALAREAREELDDRPA